MRGKKRIPMGDRKRKFDVYAWIANIWRARVDRTIRSPDQSVYCTRVEVRSFRYTEGKNVFLNTADGRICVRVNGKSRKGLCKERVRARLRSWPNEC